MRSGLSFFEFDARILLFGQEFRSVGPLSGTVRHFMELMVGFLVNTINQPNGLTAHEGLLVRENDIVLSYCKVTGGGAVPPIASRVLPKFEYAHH